MLIRRIRHTFDRPGYPLSGVNEGSIHRVGLKHWLVAGAQNSTFTSSPWSLRQMWPQVPIASNQAGIAQGGAPGFGPSARFASGHHIAVPAGYAPTAASESMMIMAWARSTSVAEFASIWVYDYTDSVRDVYLLRLDQTTGAFLAHFNPSNGSAASMSDSTKNWADGQVHLFAGKMVSGASSAWIDGRKVATSSQVLGTPNTTISTWNVGNNAAVTQGFIGDLFDLRIYSPAPSDEVMYSLFDPAHRWDLYRKPRQATYVFIAAGGGGTTYNETVGLSAAGALAHTAVLSISQTIGLGAAGAVTPSGPLTLQQQIAIQASAQLTPTHVATILGSLALTGSATLTPGGQLVLGASATLAAAAQLQQAGGFDLSVSIALAANAALALVDSRGFTEALTLSAAANLTQAAQAQLANQLALQALTDIQTAVTAQLGATTALQASAQVQQAAIVQMTNTLALAAAALLTQADTLIDESTPTILRMVGAALAGAALSNVGLRAPGRLTDVELN